MVFQGFPENHQQVTFRRLDSLVDLEADKALGLWLGFRFSPTPEKTGCSSAAEEEEEEEESRGS